LCWRWLCHSKQEVSKKLKKCTSFQIQISHNLLNIRCSAVSWPILYLTQTWIMLNLNIFLWLVYLFIEIEVILNSHVQKTLCFHDLLIREIIRLSNYYNRLRLIWIWKGVHFFDTPCCISVFDRKLWVPFVCVIQNRMPTKKQDSKQDAHPYYEIRS
jgi:hypothetical protein